MLLLGKGPTGLLLAQLLRVNGGCHIAIAAPLGLKMELPRSLNVADGFLGLR